MSFLVTLFALSLVVFVHELGHMFFARRAGIGVIEFSVGFGPILFSKTHQNTRYAFRLLPVGGYVKLAGLDESTQNFPEAQKFSNATLLNRMKVILAGSLMNVLLALFIIFILISTVGIKHAKVTGLLDNSAAQVAGLQANDVILTVNDRAVFNLTKDLVVPIQEHLQKPLKLTYSRDKETQTVYITPTLNPNTQKGMIGVEFGAAYAKVSLRHILPFTLKTARSIIHGVFYSFSELLSGRVNMKDMAGPVGIIQLASFSLEHSLIFFVEMIALISMSLGIINLFPFPVLDGGHLVLLIIEGILGRPLNQKLQDKINQFGALVLIFLMGVVLINDILNWSTRMAFLKNLSP